MAHKLLATQRRLNKENVKLGVFVAFLCMCFWGVLMKESQRCAAPRISPRRGAHNGSDAVPQTESKTFYALTVVKGLSDGNVNVFVRSWLSHSPNTKLVR